MSKADRKRKNEDATDAFVRRWFLALAAQLLKLVESVKLSGELRRAFSGGLIVIENWVAVLVFLRAAARFSACGRPERPTPANALPGFRSTHTFTGLLRRYARANHRGTLAERARRLVAILRDMAPSIRLCLRRLSRGPHGAGLVVCAPLADALRAPAPTPVACADTS